MQENGLIRKCHTYYIKPKVVKIEIQQSLLESVSAGDQGNGHNEDRPNVAKFLLFDSKMFGDDFTEEEI